MQTILKLEKPVEYYPEGCKPLFKDHNYMKYYLDNEGNFYKTNKVSSPKIFRDNLINENNILNYMKGKNYVDNLSPPSCSEFNSEGNLVIIQKAFNGGDFMDYILKNNNFGSDTATDFLRNIIKILKSLDEFKIIYGDFCFENLMIESYNPLKLILVDFGCAKIIDNNNYVLNIDKILRTRHYQMSPDLELSYQEGRMMSNESYYQLMLKKDLFSIGVLLYNILFGKGIWFPNKRISPEEKNKILIKVRNQIIEKKNRSMTDEKSIYEILLKLLPIKLKDIISLKELDGLILQLKTISRKRSFSCL